MCLLALLIKFQSYCTLPYWCFMSEQLEKRGNKCLVTPITNCKTRFLVAIFRLLKSRLLTLIHPIKDVLFYMCCCRHYIVQTIWVASWPSWQTVTIYFTSKLFKLQIPIVTLIENSDKIFRITRLHGFGFQNMTKYLNSTAN